MKRTLSLLGLVLLTAALTFAQDKKPEVVKEMTADPTSLSRTTMHGYVVDAMCASRMMKNSETTMKKAAAHSKACALEEDCASSGYGLISDGKWYKFDEKGDKEAQAWIEKTKLEKGLMVEVSGEMSGEVFALASIQEHAMDTEKKSDVKTEKKSDAKEDYKHK